MTEFVVVLNCASLLFMHRCSRLEHAKHFNQLSVPCMGISDLLKIPCKFACVSLVYLTEALVLCVFQTNKCSLLRVRGKGNPCSGITTSKVSTVSPDGNSRPQNTGMNATFSLVVTSFIQKDTLVKAEVGEDVTREVLSVCKNTLPFNKMHNEDEAQVKCTEMQKTNDPKTCQTG